MISLCSNVEYATFVVFVVKIVHVVEIDDHGHSVHLPVPEDNVAEECSLELGEQESQQQLAQLQARQVK